MPDRLRLGRGEGSIGGSNVAGWRRSFTSPRVRAFWKSARSGHEIGFVNFMDKIMSELAVSPLVIPSRSGKLM